MKMKKVVYNDGMLSRMRKKYAGFVLNGEYIPFHEAEEKKVAVIKEMKYKKAGIWSSTIYEIYTKSATFVMGYRPFDGWAEDIEEMIKHIIRINKLDLKNEVTREEAKIFLENEFPNTWTKVLEKQNKINELL